MNARPDMCSLRILLSLAAAGFISVCASEFSQTAKLSPSNPSGGDRFGAGLALSGNTLVVAAPEYRGDGKFGAAHVYEKTSSGWEFVTRLLSPYSRPFATSVATDGETIVIGGMEDRAAFGGIDAGLAFVYAKVAGAWSLVQELSSPDVHAPNRAATAVAVEDDTIVIGVDSDATFGPTAGAAYVFTKSADRWTFQQKLYASELAEGARFGSAADLHGNYLAIAAPIDGGARGSVHLFGRENGIWTHKERVVAPESFSGAIFGKSLALSDGLLIVGRTDDNDAAPGAGAAYVFRLLPQSREFVQKLLPASGEVFAGFGTSVALAGTTVLVGASSAPWQGAPTVGNVYAFEETATGFAQSERFTSEDPTSFSGFGWSLAADADNVAVGAPFQEANGIVYTFEHATIDVEPPTITGATANPSLLSPPNNKLVPVSLAVEASDDSGLSSCRIISVTLDDPTSVRKQPAFEITGDLTVNLRAEKNSRGRTRIYSVVVECRDEAGNADKTTVQVEVR